MHARSRAWTEPCRTRQPTLAPVTAHQPTAAPARFMRWLQTYDHTLSPIKRSRLLTALPSTNQPAICVNGRCPPKLSSGQSRTWSDPEQKRWHDAQAKWGGSTRRVLTLFEEPFEASQQQLRRYTGKTVHVLKMDCDG